MGERAAVGGLKPQSSAEMLSESLAVCFITAMDSASAYHPLAHPSRT